MLTAFVHHIEQAARRAGVRFDGDCRAELEGDAHEVQQRLEKLGEQIALALEIQREFNAGTNTFVQTIARRLEAEAGKLAERMTTLEQDNARLRDRLAFAGDTADGKTEK